MASANNPNTVKESIDSFRSANYREVNRPYNYVQSALIYGILGGLIIGIFQCGLYFVEGEINIGHELLGYILLTPFLYLALKNFRNHHAGGEVFKMGILHGMSISAIASILMTVVATIGMAWYMSPDSTPGGMSMGEFVANSSFQILVGIVFGMTITFIILQGLKSDMRADKHIDKPKA